MKKLVYFIAFAGLLIFSGCAKTGYDVPKDSSNEYVFDFTVNNVGKTSMSDTATKGDATTGMDDGERIFVFFSPEGGSAPIDSYLILTKDGGSWGQNVPKGLSPMNLGDYGKLSAIYVPFMKSEEFPEYKNGKWMFEGYKVFYSCAENVDYSVNGQVVSASISMAIPDGFVQFAVTKSKAAEGNVMESNYVTAVDAVLNNDMTFSAEEAEINAMIGHLYGDYVYFSGVLSPIEDDCWFFLTNSGKDYIKILDDSSKLVKNKSYILNFD